MADTPERRYVLIVEDEPIIRSTLAEFLAGEGFEVTKAGSVAEALAAAKQRDFHVAICDVQLPDGDGVALLRKLQRINSSVFVLIITAYATVENAIEAFKAGAFDYLVKPVILDDVLNKLNRVFQFRQLFLENQALRRELSQPQNFEQVVGSSQPLRELLATITKVAATSSTCY